MSGERGLRNIKTRVRILRCAGGVLLALASISLLISVAGAGLIPSAGSLLPQSETQTPTPSSTATPSSSPVSAPSPTPQSPVSSDHLWLDWPIDQEGNQQIDRFYPYGSTGNGQFPLHHGVEFENPFGTPVRAAASGVVVYAGTDDEVLLGPSLNHYGKLVIVRLDRPYQGQEVFNLYAHLSSIDVEHNQHISRGELIGEVGESGSAGGPHLHFEVRVGVNQRSASRNPELWFEPRDGHGVIVGRVVNSEGDLIAEALVTIQPAAELGEWSAEIRTYPHTGVNPDDDLNENFAVGDVPSGEYVVAVRVEGELYATEQVRVEPDETTYVKLRGSASN